MRKKQKKQFFVWGGIILAVAVLIGIILMATGNFPGLAIGGTSTLSIDRADLKSTNPYFSGDTWIITFSANSLGQSYYGDFTPNDVEDATSGDLRSTKDFTVEVDYEDTVCKYPIQGSSLDPIKDIKLVEWTYIPFVASCDEGESKSRVNNLLLYGKYGFSVTCFAIGSDTSSTIKNIQNPDISADYTITVNAGGKSSSASFNTLEGKTSGPIGDFAYSVWNGNLDSGKSCPSQDNYYGAYVNGVWKVINKNNYNNYRNAYDDLIRFTNSDASKDTVRRTVETVQSRANSARVSTSFGSIINSGSLSNARIEVPTNTPLQFPLTTLYMKASSIGVYTPVPDFSISSQGSECFKTGTEGVVSFNLKNSGEKGGYNAYATCGGVFSGIRNIQGTLDSGSSTTVKIPLSAQASQKETGTCQITVESTGKTVTKDVSVCVDPQITCEVPYPKTFCGFSQGAEAVMQCSQDGATRNIIEVCQPGYVCSDNTQECVIDDGTHGGGFWDSIKNFFSNLFSGTLGLLKTIKIGLIVIGSLLTLFISAGQLRRIKELNKLNWARWLIAVAIAGFVAYVLYLFIGGVLFWIILGGLVATGVVITIFFPEVGLLLLKSSRRR